jgi:hypothetical protein
MHGAELRKRRTASASTESGFDVAPDAGRPHAAGANPAATARGILVDVSQHDICASVGKRERNCAADTPAAPSDSRLVLERFHGFHFSA